MWSRFDDDFHDNAKVLSLSHQAFRLYVTSITLSSRLRSRGFLTRTQAEALARQQGIQPTALRELVQKRGWEEEQEGYRVHDYDDYHPKDPTAADRMARHRARNTAVTKTVTPPSRDCDENVTRSGTGTGTGTGPDPEPVPDPVREGTGERGMEPVAPYAEAPGAPARKSPPPIPAGATRVPKTPQEIRDTRDRAKRLLAEVEARKTGSA